LHLKPFPFSLSLPYSFTYSYSLSYSFTSHLWFDRDDMLHQWCCMRRFPHVFFWLLRAVWRFLLKIFTDPYSKTTKYLRNGL
jgi:hypothetical protein